MKSLFAIASVSLMIAGLFASVASACPYSDQVTASTPVETPSDEG